ncbi:MAG: hypothetical protein Q8M98_04480 [Candidatus Cloacimonadaceae bacterium]|nr:hypothetical protein [Candidatus Cloacimonadaceae bacterium]MDP3114016.1 hypothetical protein [Candidatus Cloacimonadaceae bacterium]
MNGSSNIRNKKVGTIIFNALFYLLFSLTISSCAIIVNNKPRVLNDKFQFMDVDISFSATVNESVFHEAGEGRSPLLENKYFLQQNSYDIIQKKLMDSGIFNNVKKVGEPLSTGYNIKKPQIDTNNGFFVNMKVNKTIEGKFLVPFFLWGISLGTIPAPLAHIEIEILSDVYSNKTQ